MKIFKNSEMKKLTIVLVIVFASVFVLSFFVSQKIMNSYENYYLNYNAKIISTIISKYPEAEKEVVQEMLTGNNDDGLKELEKYGISKESVKDLVEPINDEYNKVLHTVIISNVLIYLILVIIIFLFLIKMYQKIRRLSDYTLNIAYRNYNIDISDNNEGDLSILKNHLYDITRILKENNELLENDKTYLKNAIADISHQLKTPLTSLYLVNEILSNEKDEVKRSEFLIKMRDEIERIEWLVSSLLKMSKLDSQTVILRNETFEASSLIKSTFKDLASLIDEKKIKIVVNNNDNVVLNGDFNWLKEAFINIIKNGIEHSTNDSKINIDISDNPMYTKIVIKDDGEGVAPSDIPYIFDRFYKAKGSSKNSIGIGLALAKSIINSQNGDISVKSKLGEYTAFTIKLYKLKNY